MNVAILSELAGRAEEMDVYPNAMFPPSRYYRFLRLLAQRVRPDVSVELGVCGGGASLHLALGHPPGKVIGIDIRNSWPENVAYVKETCPNFEFWQMDSFQATIRYKEADLPSVDVLFIDTVHTYDRTMLEFNAWRDLLSSDAVVCFDDLYREGMDRVWEELPGEKWRKDRLHEGGSPTDGGFGVLYDIP